MSRTFCNPSLQRVMASPAVNGLATVSTTITFLVSCWTDTFSDGAGHYVKMVHNGIEYGDMQLISEVMPQRSPVVA
jgi:6-phosphogluconate dehydrogenase